ncbi:MAG TPA: hypothetical protein VI306_08055 [Pyrinomonadaceae bacterium]
MSIIGTLVKTLSDWSGVPTSEIKDLDEEICVLLARGRGGVCDTILSRLIPSLKQAFPDRKLGGLRVKDMKSGKLKTIDTLYDYIRTSAKKD